MSRPLPRWVAASEAALVSGVPTQFLVANALVLLAGFPIPQPGAVPLAFLVTMSLVDTAVIVGLVTIFLKRSQEQPRAVFVGNRPWARDVLRGVLLVPVVAACIGVMILALRHFLPWTHTVATNPMLQYLDSPASAAWMLAVVIIAGGVREELQRAFVLHRFGQSLGGMRVGLVLFTLIFGALHLDQGVDVALAVGTLGLWWGFIYIRHRSAVMPMANHAAFNALQVVQAFLLRGAA